MSAGSSGLTRTRVRIVAVGSDGVDGAQRLLEQVADLALRHRVEDVERQRGRVGLAARLLQRERADLRAVAVREHDLVRAGDAGDRLRGLDGVAVCSVQVPRSSSRISALPPKAMTMRMPAARRQELRIASQIARAGSSDGLAHECG